MGNLFIQIEKRLFPDDLRHEKPHGIVGKHVFRKIHRSLADKRTNLFHTDPCILSLQCADSDDLIEHSGSFVFFVNSPVFLRPDQIDFIDDEYLRRLFNFLQQLQDISVSGTFRETVVHKK